MWTDAKNDRRCELVDRKIAGTLTEAEAAELADLQEQMVRHRDRVVPLPLEYARKLHQELFEASGANPRPTGPVTECHRCPIQ